jgi:Family of unknown function (DUF6338)
MEFTLEGFFIATLGILPGFFLSLVKTIINPEGEKAKIEEWLATSILASLGLNLVVAALFVLFVIPIDLNKDVDHLVKQLQGQKLVVLLWYAGSLYLAALVLGVLSSLKADWRLGVLVYRWRLTPISPVPNVFNDTLEFAFRRSANLRLRGRPEQMVPWIRLRRTKVVVVGRLRRSSVRFDVDKPVEVFLSPAYIFEDSTIRGTGLPNGVYLRVLATDVVEILSAPASWIPERI